MTKWISSLKTVFLTLLLVVSTSCNNNNDAPKLPKIEGVEGPSFNLLDGKVLITIKLLNASIQGGGIVPIPETRDSHFELSPNIQDGGMMIVFHLDVEDLKAINIGIGDGNTLPDGRAIPGIPGGVMQDSLRADTDLLDMSFYFSKKLFGFFIPLPWDTHGLGGYWNIVIEKKTLGLLGAVASDDQGHGAGITLFLNLDKLKDKKVKKLIELSKKNPHTMF